MKRTIEEDGEVWVRLSDLERALDDAQNAWKRVLEAEAERDRLRGAMTEAVDLLLERTYGSPVRMPGHNARLVLQAALKSGTSEEAAERTKTIKAAPRRRRVADDEIPF